MDTNLNIPHQKKVVSVEILHLDEVGYGPQGKHTRRLWRAECLENLLAGKVQFAAWQASWKSQIQKKLPQVSLASNLTYDDGTQEIVLGQSDQKNSPYELDFVAHLFKEDVTVKDYIFENIANFSSAIFGGNAFFGRASFTKQVHFSSAKFAGNVYFSRTTFDENASFSSAMFAGNAFFSRTTFTRHAYFSRTIFAGTTYFNRAMITRDAIFRYAKFAGVASFGRARFTRVVNFSNATFGGDALFSRATFTRAYFISTTFTGYANFSSARFTGYAVFGSATFTGNADFRSARFTGNADFKLSTFYRECHFENSFDKETKNWTQQTKFEGLADFENAIFKNVGHFERVHFVKHTPAFRGCQIDSTRVEFSDDSYFPCNESSDDAIKNISFLKRLSDEHGQTDQALNFNAMELRAKRLQTEPKAASRSFKVVTWLYEKVSDYGRSFIQPLKMFIYLFLVTFIGALIFAGKSAPIICTERMLQYDGDIQFGSPVSCLSYYQTTDEFKLSGYRAAFEYASYRSSGMLDFSDNDKQTSAINMRVFDQKVEPSWVRVYGIFKGIASTALLFLAALGLRNKYRIK